LKHGQVQAVGELKAAEFVHSEPADGIVLFQLAILYWATPGDAYPHSEVQAVAGVGLPKNGLSVDISEVNGEFLTELSPECVRWALARLDVTAREVPDIWIPLPTG
jgi:hypothetical protein